MLTVDCPPRASPRRLRSTLNLASSSASNFIIRSRSAASVDALASLRYRLIFSRLTNLSIAVSRARIVHLPIAGQFLWPTRNFCCRSCRAKPCLLCEPSVVGSTNRTIGALEDYRRAGETGSIRFDAGWNVAVRGRTFDHQDTLGSPLLARRCFLDTLLGVTCYTPHGHWAANRWTTNARPSPLISDRQRICAWRPRLPPPSAR